MLNRRNFVAALLASPIAAWCGKRLGARPEPRLLIRPLPTTATYNCTCGCVYGCDCTCDRGSQYARVFRKNGKTRFGAAIAEWEIRNHPDAKFVELANPNIPLRALDYPPQETQNPHTGQWLTPGTSGLLHRRQRGSVAGVRMPGADSPQSMSSENSRSANVRFSSYTLIEPATVIIDEPNGPQAVPVVPFTRVTVGKVMP